jgi:hypothetical protein
VKVQVTVLQSLVAVVVQVHIIQTVMAVDRQHLDTVMRQVLDNQVVVASHHVVALVQVTDHGHLDHQHSQEYNLEAAGVAVVTFAATVDGQVADTQVVVTVVTERPAEQAGTVAAAAETVALTVVTEKAVRVMLLDKLQVVQV